MEKPQGLNQSVLKIKIDSYTIMNTEELRRNSFCIICVFLISFLNAVTEEWPNYLGKDLDGIWNESGISLDIKKHPPRLVWSTKISSGYSGPSVSGKYVYVSDFQAEPYDPGELSPGTNINFVRGTIKGKERLICLNEQNGKIKWTHSHDQTYTSAYAYAIGPRTTPLIDEDLVFTLGAEGQLTAYQAKLGVPTWTRNLIKDFEFSNPEWGTSTHPIVHKNLLICIAGGEGSAVVAFNKKTGEVVWKALNSKKSGYSTLVIRIINGIESLLVWHGESVNALDPDNGNLIWSVPFKPTYGMSIAAPVVWKNLVYVMGFSAKSGVIEVSEGGEAARLLWGPSPRLGVAGVFNTPFIKNGIIYSGGRRGIFKSVQMLTGETLWEDSTALLKADGSGKGGWLSAFTVHHEPSGKTLILNDHGELIISTLTPEKFREEARMQLIEPTHLVSGRKLVWSHPAFAHGKIYCRNDKEIRCWDFSFNETR